MADTHHEPEPKNFAPKNPPKLNPPRDDLISVGDLAKCDGTLRALDSGPPDHLRYLTWQVRALTMLLMLPSREPSSTCRAKTPMRLEVPITVRQQYADRTKQSPVTASEHVANFISL